jgi:hypothetical protein
MGNGKYLQFDCRGELRSSCQSRAVVRLKALMGTALACGRECACGCLPAFDTERSRTSVTTFTVGGTTPCSLVRAEDYGIN